MINLHFKTILTGIFLELPAALPQSTELIVVCLEEAIVLTSKNGLLFY